MATIKEQLEGHTSDIITATQKLLEDLSDREGQYVWKQLTAEGGDFVAFVTADDENSYPNKGTQDGFYYELLSQPVDLASEPDLIANNIRKGVDIFGVIGAMSEGVSGIDYGKVTITNEVRTIQVFHNLGAIPKFVALIPEDSDTIKRYYIHAVIDNMILYYDLGLDTAAFPKSRSVKETYISFESDGATRVFWPRTYYWIAIA